MALCSKMVVLAIALVLSQGANQVSGIYVNGTGIVPGCGTQRPYSPLTYDGYNVSAQLAPKSSISRCYIGNNPQTPDHRGDAPLKIREYGTAAAWFHHNMTLRNAFMNCPDVAAHIKEIADACHLMVPEGRQHGRKVGIAEGYSGPVDHNRIYIILSPDEPPYSIAALRAMGVPFFKNPKKFNLYVALEPIHPLFGTTRFWNGPAGWGDEEWRYSKAITHKKGFKYEYVEPIAVTGTLGEKEK